MCFDICLQAACCCGKACCNELCKAVQKLFGVTTKQLIRLAYIVLSLSSILIVIFLMYQLPQSLGWWSNFISCPEASGGELLCLGVSAVFRISMSLACLYLILVLFCMMRNDCSRYFNESFWCFKVAKWVGGCFLIFQAIMLIDLFYIWGEKWVAYYHNGYQQMAAILIGTTILLYSSTGYFIYKNFQWFPCNAYVNVFNILQVIVITGLTATGISKNGSLITSGGFSLFITYENWSGLNNEHSAECNQWLDDDDTMKIEIYIGIFLILCSLGYITFGAQEGGNKHTVVQKSGLLESNNQENSDEDDRNFIEDEDNDEDGEKKYIEMSNNKENKQNIQQLVQKELQNMKQQKKSTKLKDYQNNKYIYFHIIMLVSSVYISMMLTNWGAPLINQIRWSVYMPSDSSKWIKITSSWIGCLIFIWTLIAPKILQSRQF